MSAYAKKEPEETGSGTCGDKLTWRVTDDGVLTISGTGRMNDYGEGNNNYAPWNRGCGMIRKAVPEEGITYIGSHAFSWNLTEISIPESVTAIGERAFDGCTGLKSIALPSGLTEIGAHAFSDCNKITKLVIPEGVTVIRRGTFSSCVSLHHRPRAGTCRA